MYNKKIYPDYKIAERIQKVYWDNNLIDKDVEKVTGMERKTCMNYRNGVSNPNVQYIKAFCKKYKVSADWLLGV